MQEHEPKSPDQGYTVQNSYKHVTLPLTLPGLSGLRATRAAAAAFTPHDATLALLDAGRGVAVETWREDSALTLQYTVPSWVTLFRPSNRVLSGSNILYQQRVEFTR